MSDAPHDSTRPFLSVLIPLYNEVANVDPLLEKLRATLDAMGRTYEIIFVDDGSRDGTGGKIVALAQADPRIKALLFCRNFGQTAAMMASFNAARGEILIPMDGDLQNDPSDIPRLLAKLDEGFDVVSGWREERQDERVRRTLPSRAANWLISRVSGVPLRDYGCSLKAYRREAVAGVQLYGEMHRFIPIYVHWNGARIAEIPVKHHPRLHGTSHYGLIRVIKVLFDLLVVMFLLHYSRKPMYIFGTCGLVSLFISFASFVTAVFLKYYGEKTLIQTPLPTLSAITGMLGIMCFLMGLLAELSVRTYYESQGKQTYGVARRVNL
jgi:glycosyltransferase involved in cell wall biosynthesis